LSAKIKRYEEIKKKIEKEKKKRRKKIEMGPGQRFGLEQKPACSPASKFLKWYHPFSFPH
jgi:hypothetical protein